MKTLKIDFKLITLLVALALAFQTPAKGEEFKKTLKEKYDVESGAVLDIDNKFGNVVCRNWDEKAISVEVTITVNAASESKANDIFDKIHVTLNGNARRVEGKTEIDEIKGNTNFSIDYAIIMPRDINVELSNKYGTMIIPDVDGYSKIDMKYGDLEVDNLNSMDNELNLKYGDGEINYINKGILDINYASLELEKAGSLEFDSKYNDIEIEEIDMLDLETGYDEINVGEVNVLKSYARFSEFQVYKLNSSFDADMEYGGCKIRNVSKSFKDIRLTGKYTGISIGFDQEASYRISVEISYGSFDYPKNKADVSKTEISHTSAKYEGIVGSDKNTSSRVYIENTNGSVELY